ncbi:MAG: PQQ-binding-like beta-propeller repeat protein [Candidatus Pacebacteria bacterium]|nr:PQQ-binding-like beta-propeller repeat protein [Candidatus Paceibacterota bacterium]
MRKITATLLLIIILGGICWAINLYLTETKNFWVRSYGGSGIDCDSPYFIQEISKDEYMIVGTSNSFGQGEDDGLLIKINSKGEVLLSESIGLQSEDRIHQSILGTQDGQYLAVGYSMSESYGYKDFLLIKFNKDGSVLWSKKLGSQYDDVGYSITKTSDGNFIAVGWTGKITGENQDILVVKFNDEGDILWTKTYGTKEDEEQSYSVAPTNDGGVIIAAKKGRERLEALGHSNLLLIRLNSNGDIVWSKLIGGDQYYYLISPQAITRISEENYLISAETYSEENKKDGVLMKINAQGEILWSRTIGSKENNERLRAAIKTQANTYIAVGDLYNYDTSQGLLVELDEAGNILKSKIVGSFADGEANRLDSILYTFDDSYLISGKTNFYGAGDFDNLVIKIDKNLTSKSCPIVSDASKILVSKEIPQSSSVSLNTGPFLGIADKINLKVENTINLKTSLICPK